MQRHARWILPSRSAMPGMRPPPDVQLIPQVAADSLEQFVADVDECFGGLARDTDLGQV